MAINERTAIDCAANWQCAPGHPAVAFVHDRFQSDGEWWPRCQACLDELAADPDPLPHDVVYLDPTRQRRPSYVRVQSNLDIKPGTAGPYLPAAHHPRPDPAP